MTLSTLLPKSCRGSWPQPCERECVLSRSSLRFFVTCLLTRRSRAAHATVEMSVFFNATTERPLKASRQLRAEATGSALKIQTQRRLRFQTHGVTINCVTCPEALYRLGKILQADTSATRQRHVSDTCDISMQLVEGTLEREA